ncbi:reverse transcriptase domain-containing protein, partial [Tanacetum coccineum]
VVRYKEFEELIQPFEEPERVSQLDRNLEEEITRNNNETYFRRVSMQVHGRDCKRHDEHSNYIKEIQASMDFALWNKKASIKALEIHVMQMSITLQSSTNIKPRVNDEMTFETDGEKDLEARYTNSKPLGKALPRKEKDTESFTLPCFINNMCFNKALADLRASVSVMPYLTYTTLGLGDLTPTKLIIELADRTVKQPKGIAKNVLVGIDKFNFPVDFIILDISEDFKTPLILGRPFLSTAHAIINVFKAK